MSEETVGPPEGEPEPEPEPAEAGGTYGFVVGIVVALVVIALLAYFLLLTPGSTVPTNTGGTSPGSSATAAPSAGAWRLVRLA